MPNIDPAQLFLAAQLQALETLVVLLVQQSPDMQAIVRRQYELAQAQLNPGGAIPGQPELSDLLTGELQEAWSRLLQRALLPPG